MKKYISIPLAILVTLGINYLFKLMNVPIESWFILITIILLLIYFESYDKK